MPRDVLPRHLLDLPGHSCHDLTMNAAEHPLLDVEIGRSGLLNQSTLVAEISRELSVEDLGLIASTPVKGTQVLKRLRASHHQAARLLAQGLRPGEVSALSGFCPSRISVLQADPAFAELVAHYEGVVESRFADVQERMVTLGLSASEEILDRLEAEPDLISTKELVEVVKASLDRGGHAPIAKSENKSLSVTLTADDLAAMKEGTASPILDKASIHDKDSEKTPPIDITPEKNLLPEDTQSALGEVSPSRPLRIKLKTSSGLPGTGAGV